MLRWCAPSNAVDVCYTEYDCPLAAAAAFSLPACLGAPGRNYAYCKWKYVVCDAAGHVVEGINMTTDAYEVVFTGHLPPASVLKGLPGLREIDIRLHMIGGELPSEHWMLA